MSNLRRLSLSLCVLVPVALAPGCADKLATTGQLITCARGGTSCHPTDNPVPLAGQCTDVDEDGDGDDHDSDADDEANAGTPDDDDGDGQTDDVDSDDDSDGIPDSDDCDEDRGGDGDD